MVASRVSVVLLAFVALPIHQGLAHEDPSHLRETDKYHTQNVKAMIEAISRLKGGVSQCHEKIEIMAEAGVTKEQVEAVVTLFEGKLEEVDNQQQYIIDFIVTFACQSQKNNCELRRRIAALEANQGILQHGPEPTLAPPQFQSADNQQPRSRQEPHRVLRVEPIQVEEVIYWDGRVSFITDRRETFCKNAQLIAKCIDYQFADGRVYHGDVYANCDGQAVLLRHNPTRVHRVAYQW